MAEVSLTENICKNDGKNIRVQIQKNTGFCSAYCEDEWNLKEKAGTAFKKFAKKQAAKKAVRTVVE